jgi:hypothetical protein
MYLNATFLFTSLFLLILGLFAYEYYEGNRRIEERRIELSVSDMS